MKKGVNLIGYARAEFGLGEACRSAAKALEAAGIPFCILNFPHCPARQNDLSWKHKEVKEPIYNTNIIFINGDQLDFHFKKRNVPSKWLLSRYNIGYWHWELPNLPQNWKNSFRLVNEVWAPSRFTADSIAKKTSKPVQVIPHGIEVDLPGNSNRAFFGLPEKAFLFLAMFDMRSVVARKNPTGAVEAYNMAFQQNNQSAGLVLKVNNGSHSIKELNKLKQKFEGYANIHLMDGVLSRLEVNGLMNVSDSYISLHRSEGFGLPLAEAMYLGKPVIGTNWSGNIDFMKPHNSLLVNSTLKKIGINYGPYAANQHWAEPDLSHASMLMKKVAGDPAFARKIGQEGRRTIMNGYSPLAVGNMYKIRLGELGLLSNI